MDLPLGTRLLVCRGCCCGNTAKHPEVDHDAQLETLRALVDSLPGAQLSVLRCMGRCDLSNLIVVRPRSGAGLLWMAHMLDSGVIDGLGEWLRRGGDPATMPVALAGHVVHNGTSEAGAA